MFYYIDLQNDKVVSKNQIAIPVELKENQIEISEETYNSLRVPSTIIRDTQGVKYEPIENYSSVQILTESIDQEKIAMSEAIIDFEARISVLENK